MTGAEISFFRKIDRHCGGRFVTPAQIIGKTAIAFPPKMLSQLYNVLVLTLWKMLRRTFQWLNIKTAVKLFERKPRKKLPLAASRV